jgi:hypothetical protein
MAEKAKTREAAEKAYNEAYAALVKAQGATKEAKRELDRFIIRENLAARLGVDPQALDGEDLETLQRIALKAKEGQAGKGGVAKVEAVIGEGD